jgi:hypothetical protein
MTTLGSLLLRKLLIRFSGYYNVYLICKVTEVVRAFQGSSTVSFPWDKNSSLVGPYGHVALPGTVFKTNSQFLSLALLIQN